MEFERLRNIIVETLGVDKNLVTEDASFVDDLGADSLDLVDLIMGIESEFDIEVPEDAADGITTVGDVVEYLKENA